MANTKMSIGMLVLVLVLIGCAAWLFSTLGTFTASVTCIVDGFEALGDPTVMDPNTQVGASFAEFVAQVPADVLDGLRLATTYLSILTVVPAALVVVFAIIIAACVLKTKDDESTGCTKCLMFLFVFVCLLGTILYVVMGIVGIGVNLPEGQVAKSLLTTPCDTQLPELSTLLQQLQEGLDQLNEAHDAVMASGMDHDHTAMMEAIATAQAEYDMAYLGAEIMSGMCVCMYSVFDELANFTAPGIACGVVCLVLFILNLCQCCNLCCRKGGGKTAPA